MPLLLVLILVWTTVSIRSWMIATSCNLSRLYWLFTEERRLSSVALSILHQAKQVSGSAHPTYFNLLICRSNSWLKSRISWLEWRFSTLSDM